ncbi:MerR family transcriptional regulator [Shewanella baltica]|uniref:MerR family transcriptional regulator n=1 Tax=Shewanella baltica TaxID=62322 RepID=UPI0028717417|nr:MerR family transcriptional regulator [Shewanella baltica]MDR9767825.1 MerR family transcriptional regulator [Shewanella baltica]
MYIGQAAKQTGLSIKAIRLYEAWGLIEPPARQGRYRIYSPADIRLLLLIKEAKALGIKLAQLRHLLEQGDKHAQSDAVQTFLLGIKADFLRQISELEHKVTQLDACIVGLASCESQLLS